MELREWQRIVHQTAIEHGWWAQPRPIPEMLCLIHSEVSEALEAFRNHDDANLAEELADIVIRVLDMADGLQIDLEQALARKQAINVKRPYRHGGKRA